MTKRPVPFAATLLGCALLALAACERAAEAPDASARAPAADAPATDEVAPVTSPPGDVDATSVVDRTPVAGAAPDFDVKAFAGTFTAEGASLRLAADGTYTFTVHAESADADLTSTGTWTVESDGGALLLDPEAKDEADQRYEIASDDELVAVEGGRVLRRDGA